jgi:nucleotide-binding universal stress UspA family protein
MKEKFSKILVAIDGSKESMDAAEYAVAITKKHNAALVALHVVPVWFTEEMRRQPLSIVPYIQIHLA